MITSKELRKMCVTPQMKYYFDKKLALLTSEERDIRIEETLKFLNMAVFCKGNIPVSKEIDEIWHYWILETQEYENLCKKLYGVEFLHHMSNDYMEYSDKEANTREIDLEHNIAVLSSYVMNYGSFEEARVKYWHIAVRLMKLRGWSIDNLNTWLNSA